MPKSGAASPLCHLSGTAAAGSLCCAVFRLLPGPALLCLHPPHRARLTLCPALLQGQWRHYALTKRATEWLLFVDGDAMPLFGSIPGERHYPVGGTLVLGQDQDHVPGGGFEAPQAFRGYMTEVRMWNVARTQAEIVHDAHHRLSCVTSSNSTSSSTSDEASTLSTDEASTPGNSSVASELPAEAATPSSASEASGGSSGVETAVGCAAAGLGVALSYLYYLHKTRAAPEVEVDHAATAAARVRLAMLRDGKLVGHLPLHEGQKVLVGRNCEGPGRLDDASCSRVHAELLLR